MKSKKQIWTGILSALAMFLLILDAKTAIAGALVGVKLCIYSVVPALFPFILLSILINSSITSAPLRLLKPIRTLCRIPKGSETLLLLGFLGGYPIGAQSIAQSYRNGTLSKPDAHRMLGFCSNAGPAFIFGMLTSLFSSAHIIWILWIIHITSALLVGILLPGKCSREMPAQAKSVVTVPKALEQSIKTIANVCGWVILSRVLIAVCNRWFLWLLPQILQVGLIGLVELTNGCHELFAITNQGHRFILSACFLSFGGLCVTMQTISVTAGLGLGMYLPGKILQCAISFLLASILQVSIFPDMEISDIPPVVTASAIIFCAAKTLMLHKRKKVVAIPC